MLSAAAISAQPTPYTQNIRQGMYGGTIGVTTEPGAFTEFTILLPRKSSFPDTTGG